MYKSVKILVVGSFVMDLIVTTERFCNSGETVIGSGFSTAPGGKGANQAIQAARLGADVTMVGKVGNDDFGKILINSAQQSGVNTEYVFISNETTSSIGNVQIQKNNEGTENRIIVVPGANFELTKKDVEFLKDTISEYDMVILQLEIPTEVNVAVARYAKNAGVKVMLNPAPSAHIPNELIECLTYISPNEHEATDIVGVEINNDEQMKTAIKKFHLLGIDNVIITLGKNGCVFSDGKSIIKTKSADVDFVLDPTAAGDSFIGAFCTAISAGIDIKNALIFANCTAGITVSKMGAQTSLPTLNEVLTNMSQNGYDTEIYNVLSGGINNG